MTLSNAVWHSLVQWDFTRFFSNSVSEATTSLKFLQNFLWNPHIARNLMKLFLLSWKSLIACTLAYTGEIRPWPTICPKKCTVALADSLLTRFTVNWCAQSVEQRSDRWYMTFPGVTIHDDIIYVNLCALQLIAVCQWVCFAIGIA